MIVQKSRAPERAMVFDVKQFKSLEGFLESGPQFVLQLYILLHRPLEEGKELRNDSHKQNLSLNDRYLKMMIIKYQYLHD